MVKWFVLRDEKGGFPELQFTYCDSLLPGLQRVSRERTKHEGLRRFAVVLLHQSSTSRHKTSS